jgi:hypothetical protein
MRMQDTPIEHQNIAANAAYAAPRLMAECRAPHRPTEILMPTESKL